MMRRNIVKSSLTTLGQLVGIGRDEALLALRTRRQLVIAVAILVVGTLAFTFMHGGPIPLKYKGASIHDFPLFWRMF